MVRLPTFAAAFVLVACALAPRDARADVQHTIARGHTIEAIANRYGVTTKSIIEANRLKDVKRLRVGDVLTIPTKDAPKAKDGAATKSPASGDPKRNLGDKTAKVGAAKTRETTNFAMKPKTPNVIHLRRAGTTEEIDVRVSERTKQISTSALKTFERMLRSGSGMKHPIEARLVALLTIVSNHFGSRKIEVVSGFRPFSPTQHTPHSNHNHGKAVDFRVIGVPNEVVRDFCRTLKNVGCGYYPNSVFVHMDARESSAFWIDYSRPGEAPRYNAPDLGADESTSDVSNAPPESAAAAPSERSIPSPVARETSDDHGATSAAPTPSPIVPAPSAD